MLLLLVFPCKARCPSVYRKAIQVQNTTTSEVLCLVSMHVMHGSLVFKISTIKSLSLHFLWNRSAVMLGELFRFIACVWLGLAWLDPVFFSGEYIIVVGLDIGGLFLNSSEHNLLFI